jgi:hypothetical protein
MTLVPLTTCCLSLGVDPKTLRLWLKAAQLACTPHPGDARLKCLTLQELEQIAQFHGRPLPSLVPAMASHPVAAVAAQEPAATPPAPDAVHLSHQLDLLQQQVATLQAQVAELALALLAVRPSHPQSPLTVALACPALSEPGCSPAVAAVPAPTSAAQARPRVRSRALPLIQLRNDGSVVVVAPKEGVLPLVPDSAEWFAWLASIEAFSFESPAGRYSATRKFRSGQRIQAWTAHGSLHGRSCGLYLGQTPTLTLARLHQMAATVRARLSTS